MHRLKFTRPHKRFCCRIQWLSLIRKITENFGMILLLSLYFLGWQQQRRQTLHHPASLTHLPPDLQHPSLQSPLPPEQSRPSAGREDAARRVKATRPWNPRLGSYKQTCTSQPRAQLCFPWGVKFSLLLDWGLRGNINIFPAADLPRAGMQQIASA